MKLELCCPKCQGGPIGMDKIIMSGEQPFAIVMPDGKVAISQGYDAIDTVKNTKCTCLACGHTGTVRDFKPLRVNKHGNNAAIRVNILDDDKMCELGFTDNAASHWYLLRRVNAKYHISFDLSVEKDGSDWHIDVIDNEFGQPYDYQYILKKNPNNEIARKAKARVEQIMGELKNAGVIEGWNAGDYI